MSTKEKVATQVATPVAQAEKPKIDLKFADYRKFNATSIKGTFDIALIKTENNKEYVSIKNEKGEVILLVGIGKEGRLWKMTQLDMFAYTGPEAIKKEIIEM